MLIDFVHAVFALAAAIGIYKYVLLLVSLPNGRERGLHNVFAVAHVSVVKLSRGLADRLGDILPARILQGYLAALSFQLKALILGGWCLFRIKISLVVLLVIIVVLRIPDVETTAAAADGVSSGQIDAIFASVGIVADVGPDLALGVAMILILAPSFLAHVLQ